jgi:hypothetical protein
MISQLFILAPRGDTVVKKEFRFDVPKNTPEVFFRAARFWRDNEKAPAVFHERGVNYLHVKVREKTPTSCRASLFIIRLLFDDERHYTKALLSLTPRLRYVSPALGFRDVRRRDDAKKRQPVFNPRAPPSRRASNKGLLRRAHRRRVA